MIGVNFDMSALQEMFDNLSATTKVALEKVSSDMAESVRGHIVEEAKRRLHSTLEKYIGGIQVEQDEDGWFIYLDEKVQWIENGLEAFDMTEGLLKNAKTSKAGKRYRVIPMSHDPKKTASKSTPSQALLKKAISARFEKDNPGKNMKNLERGTDGKPLLGKIHSFNISSHEISKLQKKKGWANLGLQQGKVSGTSYLQGVNIYQHETKGPTGATRVTRSVVTFRTVTDDSKSQGKWQYPGKDGVHIFEETVVWAKSEFDQKVLPGIIDMISKMSS